VPYRGVLVKGAKLTCQRRLRVSVDQKQAGLSEEPIPFAPEAHGPDIEERPLSSVRPFSRESLPN
jgi:hypothetical protein